MTGKKTVPALCLALLVLLSACGKAAPKTPETPEPAISEAPAPAHFSIAALKGPTAMGLVKLMEDRGGAEAEAEAAAEGVSYDFTLAASADQVTPALIKGELDMACVPANLAAVLYQRTQGQVQVLAVNTLGVLYIVEKGNAVRAMADLAGKTVAAAGKGSTPEFALRYLLTENGVDPELDLNLDWKSEHSECVAALASGAATVALLPQPFVTVAEKKIDGLRTALDLTAEWDALNNGSALLTGVIVARRAAAEAHPEAMEAFLKDYAASVDWVNRHTAEAAELIAGFGIVESAAVAEQALPYCNIVCITGAEMREKLSGYLQVLYEAEPASVGSALPEADFYYGA